MKKYFKLIYQAHLTPSGKPMMEVDSEPVLRQLHDEMNSILVFREYLDEIVEALGGGLSGKREGYSFGHEVYYFSCDKDDCDVSEWDKKIGLLRTRDVYDMLKYFQQYRDDFYARRNV